MTAHGVKKTEEVEGRMFPRFPTQRNRLAITISTLAVQEMFQVVTVNTLCTAGILQGY